MLKNNVTNATINQFDPINGNLSRRPKLVMLINGEYSIIHISKDSLTTFADTEGVGEDVCFWNQGIIINCERKFGC